VHATLNKQEVLYLGPDGGKKNCARCVMFLTDTKRCSIHGEKVPIEGSMVCGFYVHGKPMTSKEHPPMTLVTPEESGLINTRDGGTHCASCMHYLKVAQGCEKVMGHIEDDGCCNSWLNYDLTIYPGDRDAANSVPLLNTVQKRQNKMVKELTHAGNPGNSGY